MDELTSTERIALRNAPPFTKGNPGPFDCYDAAEDGEPIFVLLARDPHAPALVELWATLRGDDPERVASARECADAMRRYRLTHGGSSVEREAWRERVETLERALDDALAQLRGLTDGR